MISVLAVYENGVLRPKEPLDLPEGQNVQLSVYPRPPFHPALPPPTPEEAEVIRKMEEAKTLQELFAAYESLPPPADGYDLCKALNDNRRATGERLLFPEAEGENP